MFPAAGFWEVLCLGMRMGVRWSMCFQQQPYRPRGNALYRTPGEMPPEFGWGEWLAWLFSCGWRHCSNTKAFLGKWPFSHFRLSQSYFKIFSFCSVTLRESRRENFYILVKESVSTLTWYLQYVYMYVCVYFRGRSKPCSLQYWQTLHISLKTWRLFL